MILQFTTGSVEDRQRYGINISVLNAGIQAANVAYSLKKFLGDQLVEVAEQHAKVAPQEESVILDEVGLKDVHCEVVLKVDSPSLIITVVGEARYPVHLQTHFVDDIDAESDGHAPPSRSITLLWGYTSKGDPF